VPAPDELTAAVAELSAQVGVDFKITDTLVTGTELFVVYADAHPLPTRYTVTSGTLGFRIPRNFPDAAPEDSFFVMPHDIKLAVIDPVRNSIDVHRASVSVEVLRGTELDGRSVLAFSWHLWERVTWQRRKHSLKDHYLQCLRRFEVPEHD